MITVKKVWGNELIIANSPLYCGKILTLFSRHRCSIHYHRIKTETFYILSGLVLMELETYSANPFIMKPGMALDISPQMKHRFTGLLDSKIIEFSSQDFEDDSYRDTISEKISDDEWKEISDKWFLGRFDDFIID
jgi:mannose-6-phosphate isomerase-like protein (cupin superfamily)